MFAEDTDNACITWSFDFSKEKLLVKNFNMIFDTKVYETGDIKILYLDENSEFLMVKNNYMFFNLFFNLRCGNKTA